MVKAVNHVLNNVKHVQVNNIALNVPKTELIHLYVTAQQVLMTTEKVNAHHVLINVILVLNMLITV